MASASDVDSAGTCRYRQHVTRGLGLAVGAGLVAACGLATSLWGCLEDLPEQASCPAPPVVEGSVFDCVGEIATAFDGGFMPPPDNLCMISDPSFTACYRGPSGCDCNTEGRKDCVVAGDEEACFPNGDCPLKVREQFPDARCMTLQPDDIGPFSREPEQCLCGCEHCMSVCDGRGPVWSQFEFLDQQGGSLDGKGILFFFISRHMPSKGTLGVYLRARGTSLGPLSEDGGASFPPVLAVGPSDAPPNLEEAPVWVLPRDLDDRFSEVVLPAPGEQVYTWNSGDTKPGILSLYAGNNVITLMEIDCIVPFVIE